MKKLTRNLVIALLTVATITSCGVVSEHYFYTDKQPCAICQTMVTRSESHRSEYESMRMCDDCCKYSSYMDDYICNDSAVYIPEKGDYVHKDLATACPNCGENIIKETETETKYYLLPLMQR